ncbi:hypothetical protein Back2_08140 [Nocardioides baekrokdamisoli]|uniref:Uncharacterized protein n=1 Tax=Nocardioides baekrokdamisoli TaxID=1804624 RepID=A0A3G9IC86_9ACTN|nr:hypothetical protein Back2_08140 [Nocardioides baekrokdamisoli]
MGAVLVHLDAGLRIELAVGVAAKVRTTLKDEDSLAELSGHPLRDGQAEEAGADDHKVRQVRDGLFRDWHGLEFRGSG